MFGKHRATHCSVADEWRKCQNHTLNDLKEALKIECQEIKNSQECER